MAGWMDGSDLSDLKSSRGYKVQQEKHELQDVLKFPIEIFWNLEARKFL